MKQFSYVSEALRKGIRIRLDCSECLGTLYRLDKNWKSLFAMVYCTPILIDVFGICTMIRIIPSSEEKSDDFDDPLFLSFSHFLIDHILNNDPCHS
jgi:hypothetical protein